MSNNVIKSLLKYLENGNEVDRCYAAKTLGNLKVKEATKALLKRIKDEDTDVRMDAISALGKIKDTSALPSLLECLEKDPDNDIKLAVTESLAHYQSKEAINTLLNLAKDRPENINFEQKEDKDSWRILQEKAIVILGEIQLKEAFPVLKNLLEDDSNQAMEVIILTAIAKLDDADADEYLINRMNGATEKITEIQQHRTATALVFSQSKSTLQSLGRALVNPSADTRENILYALGKRKATAYIKAVVLSLRDPAANVKRAALQVLQDLATESQTNKMFNYNQIAAMLDNQNATFQAAVLAFFQEQHKLSQVINTLSDENQQLFIQCLDSENDNVLAQAAQLASITADPKSVSLLFKLAESDEHSTWVRKEAILALGHTINKITDTAEKQKALSDLRSLIQNDEQAVRSSALQALLTLSNLSDALETLSQADTLPPIATLLATLKGEQFDFAIEDEANCNDREQSRNTETGTSISEELNNEIDEFVIIMRKNFNKGKKIIRRKIDTHADARYICARLLSNNSQAQYDELIVNALAECLYDDDEALRQEAAESLSKISLKNPLVPGISNAFGQLVTLLDSKDSDMRLACIHAIAHSGNRAALPHLLNYLSDEEYLIQLHALNGLVYIINNKANLTPEQQTEHIDTCEITNEKVIAALYDCLNNKNYSVSMAAIEALTDLQQTEAIEQFIKIALSDEGQSAEHISKLLKKLDAQKSTKLLLTHLDTVTDSSYRRYVMEMLEVIANPDEAQLATA